VHDPACGRRGASADGRCLARVRRLPRMPDKHGRWSACRRAGSSTPPPEGPGPRSPNPNPSPGQGRAPGRTSNQYGQAAYRLTSGKAAPQSRAQSASGCPSRRRRRPALLVRSPRPKTALPGTTAVVSSRYWSCAGPARACAAADPRRQRDSVRGSPGFWRVSSASIRRTPLVQLKKCAQLGTNMTGYKVFADSCFRSVFTLDTLTK